MMFGCAHWPQDKIEVSVRLFDARGRAVPENVAGVGRVDIARCARSRHPLPGEIISPLAHRPLALRQAAKSAWVCSCVGG